MLTVVPSAKSRLNVSPAGTVNELMFTVVHLTAADTSDIDEMVPVHDEDACGAAAANEKATERITNAIERAMANYRGSEWCRCLVTGHSGSSSYAIYPSQYEHVALQP